MKTQKENVERPTPNAQRRSQRQACLLSIRCSVFSAILLFVALAGSARAQSIILTTGQKIDALGVRREGDMVLAKVQVGSGSGEVGYHLAQIAKIEFPEPRGLKESSDLLSQGQADKALAEINQVVSFYDPFKDVPGSWWSQAALIKVAALGALQRDTQAELLAGQIEKAVTDPETARAARLRLVNSLIRRQDFDKAEKICDSAIKDSVRPEIIAEAWIKKGDLFFAQRKWDDALIAYLHVPVFYRDEKSFVPAALLGSARSYVRLDQNERARKSLNELIQMFPKSAEASVAQTEIQKMGK
jgi:tetratricopeptide (TPR) repeat protein